MMFPEESVTSSARDEDSSWTCPSSSPTLSVSVVFSPLSSVMSVSLEQRSLVSSSINLDTDGGEERPSTTPYQSLCSQNGRRHDVAVSPALDPLDLDVLQQKKAADKSVFNMDNERRLCSAAAQRCSHVRAMVCCGLPGDGTGAYFTGRDIPGIPDCQGRWVEGEEEEEEEEGR
ncbi:hypothetical protein EYF80_021988 [Liparis tanakae]|uniref:Uncharacterized protein n=1 Tax=Liparis tanakae TaxID=230148 RepID=A0A4Z2HS52_9TELE|nr:hypothetical protein EYF80_021988 [Liparis tanakae]